MSKEDMPAILYVDDEPLNLRVFDANFRSRFRIVTCESGPAALEMLHRIGEVGLLIADQRMPEMTGVQLLQRARELLPDAQRMLLTAFSDIQAVMDAVNHGQVNRYFVKPWIREELMAALEDMMRIYMLQSRLREIETRLMKSERLAAIGQVSAGVAHELMNPVSYMSQNIGLLRGEMKVLTDYLTPMLQQHPNADVQHTLGDLPQILDDVETGAKHIRQVALGIRSQARGEDAELVSDLADVASFAVKLARAEVRQRARVTVDQKSVRVAAGPVRLCQVLLNLIVNASQAMDNKGTSGLVEVHWEEEEHMVRVSVRDNGSGISPENQKRVFEPLFTTKSAGTGLGLAICRDIIIEMGGEISLTSEVGQGTEVRFTLPKAPVVESGQSSSAAS
jgi:signal transduction histidine kinase